MYAPRSRSAAQRAKEYNRARISFRSSRADPDWRLPLRRGVVVAPSDRDGQLAEICLLPFLFVVPEPRIAWEPCSILRVGPCLDRLDAAAALRPMEALISGCAIGVREFHSFHDPLVRGHFRENDLVVALDRGSLHAVTEVWPLPNPGSVASLVDEVPWHAVYGRSLRPLESWCPGGSHAPSGLRTCALVGLVLSQLAPRGGGRARSAFDYLLAARATVFEESSWTPPPASRAVPPGDGARSALAGGP